MTGLMEQMHQGVLGGSSGGPLGFEVRGLPGTLLANTGLVLLALSSFCLLRGLSRRSLREGLWWIVAAFGSLFGFVALFLVAA